MSGVRGLSIGRYDAVFKQKVIDAYLKEEKDGITVRALAQRFGVSYSFIARTIRKHKNGEPLVGARTIRHSIELKKEIVAEYVRKKQKFSELAAKFQVSRTLARTLINRHKKGKPIINKRRGKPKPRITLPERSAAECERNRDQLVLVARGELSCNKLLYG